MKFICNYVPRLAEIQRGGVEAPVGLIAGKSKK